jgi:hypothetical protein
MSAVFLELWVMQSKIQSTYKERKWWRIENVKRNVDAGDKLLKLLSSIFSSIPNRRPLNQEIKGDEN